MSHEESIFGPYLDAALQLQTAAQHYLAQSVQGNGVAAAHAFADFLRDQSSRLVHGAPWAAPLDLPALGQSREHQLRAARAADAARCAAAAQRRLQTLWFDALRDAATDFAARLAAQGSAMPPGAAAQASAADAAAGALQLRGLYDSWIDCAEAAYAQMVRGDAFCEALAEFVNAGSRWRAEHAAGMEFGAKALDLPTRSEINSLNRRLQVVEEQLRAETQRRSTSASRRVGRTPRGRRVTPKRT